MLRHLTVSLGACDKEHSQAVADGALIGKQTVRSGKCVPPPLVHQRCVSLTLETITQRVLIVRGQRVLMNADLVAVYDAPTECFN